MFAFHGTVCIEGAENPADPLRCYVNRIFMIIVIIRGCIRIIHGSSDTLVAYFVYQISITILVRQTGSGLNAFPVRLANLDFCPYTAWVQNQCQILGFSYTMRHK